MRRLLCIVPVIILLSACTIADHNETPEMTQEEIRQKKKERDEIKQQLAEKDKQLLKVKEDRETLEKEIEKTRRERDDITKELDERLKNAQKLMEEAQELARKLRPPTEEEEKAAEKLLLEAQYFQKDNPTEAKSVVAAKYMLVYKKYPRTKAAKLAEKMFKELSK